LAKQNLFAHTRAPAVASYSRRPAGSLEASDIRPPDSQLHAEGFIVRQNINQTNQWIGQTVEERSNCPLEGLFSAPACNRQGADTRQALRGRLNRPVRIVACLLVLALCGLRSWQQPSSYIAAEVVSDHPSAQAQPAYTADIIDDIIVIITGGGTKP